MLFAGLRKKKALPVVTATLPVDDVVGNSLLSGKQFFTRCDVFASFGPEHTAYLPKDYRWDGASIPRIAWTLLGLNPSDRRTIIASGFHDRGCESDAIPQAIADSTFISLLQPIRFNGYRLKGVGKFRATLMYMAVRFYSIFIRPLRGR